MSIPQGVRESLKAWREATPLNTPGDWDFAGPATGGKRPFWPDSMLIRYIQPVAESAGLGHIGWHTFRHSLSAWGKEALKLEETNELLRHSNIQTTSDIYGGLSLEAKRKAQANLIYCNRTAKADPPQFRVSAKVYLLVRPDR